MPTFGMLLLVNMDIFCQLPMLWKWVAVIGTFVFTGILPAVPILLMMRRGEVNDLFISERKERTMPYMFSLLSYVFWVLFLYRTLQFPTFIIAMGIGSASSIFVILLINTRWKISAHMAGIGGLAGSIFAVCYRTAINPVWFLAFILFVSALVALSRMELKAHSTGQILAGYLLGFLMIFIPGMVA